MKLLVLVSCILLASCTNGDKSKEVLESEGFTNIEITGYRPFICIEDDTYSTGFKATNKNGQQVKGCVCGGLFKGYTVRFE